MMAQTFQVESSRSRKVIIYGSFWSDVEKWVHNLVYLVEVVVVAVEVRRTRMTAEEIGPELVWMT